MTRRAEGASTGLRLGRGEAEWFRGDGWHQATPERHDLYVAPQLSWRHRVLCRPRSRRKPVLSRENPSAVRRSGQVFPGVSGVSGETGSFSECLLGQCLAPSNAQCGPTLPQALA